MSIPSISMQIRCDTRFFRTSSAYYANPNAPVPQGMKPENEGVACVVHVMRETTCRPSDWLVKDEYSNNDDELVELRRRFDRLIPFCAGLVRERDELRHALDREKHRERPSSKLGISSKENSSGEEFNADVEEGRWSRVIQVFAVAICAFVVGRSSQHFTLDFFIRDF